MSTNTERRAAWASKLNPHAIATTASPRHIQSVIEEAAGHIAAMAVENAELLRTLREIEALDSTVVGLDRIEYARNVARAAIAKATGAAP